MLVFVKQGSTVGIAVVLCIIIISKKLQMVKRGHKLNRVVVIFKGWREVG